MASCDGVPGVLDMGTTRRVMFDEGNFGNESQRRPIKTTIRPKVWGFKGLPTLAV